jgi:hypothetical protein
MSKNMNKLFYFGLFLILFVFIFSLKSFNKRLLGFTNYNLAEPGIYPSSVDLPILSEVYPYSGSKTVSDDSYPDIWWHYPVLKTGSYKQITNNLRYYRNPDEGTCITADFCGALYKDKDNKSNIIYPMPPVPPGPGPRVNYYRSSADLMLQPDTI